MKKILLPFVLVAGLLFTITSCDKEPDKKECTMCGDYSGNIVTNDTLKIHVGSVINTDTTFSSLASTAKVTETSSDDSLDIIVSLNIAGVDIDLDVRGYKATDSKLTITDYIYNYNNITDILVNGSVIVTGDDAVANVILSKAPGSPASVNISGDLTFTGSK